MILSYLPEGHPLWPDVLPLLKDAADYGGIEVWEPGDLVWVAFDGPTVFGAAVTRPGEEAELRLAGGTRFREWIGLLDHEVSEWARINGAAKLTMRGRIGWKRFADRFGWSVLGIDEDGLTIFEKVLCDG